MYRISKYHIGQQDAENLMKTVSLQRKGLMLVTLTNFENTSAPAIARGSLCEVANTLYESAGEAILGTAVNGLNYIKLRPTSDDNIAAYYTQAAPAWNAELGGWYGVGDSANHRYVASFLLLSGLYYEKKYLIYGNKESSVVRRKFNITLPINSVFVLKYDSFIVTRTAVLVPLYYYYPDGGSVETYYGYSRGAFFPAGKFKIKGDGWGCDNVNIDILADVPDYYTLADVVTVI